MVAQDALTALLAPTVTGLGYELLGIERQQAAGGSTVRLYIDSADGIGVEDCERVSRQVSDILDVEQAVSGEYTLEVSSPGVDRPLFTPAHYAAFIGAEVKVRLRTLVDGRRNVSGNIVSATDDVVTIGIGEEVIDVPYNVIERGRLVPQW